MKGIAVWVWVIGGIIVGMVLFASFFQIMSMLVANKESEAAKQNIDDLASIASSFCEMGPGRSTEKKFTLPNAADKVFASNDQFSISMKNGRNYGEYLCIKTSDSSNAYCKKADCELEMAFAINEKTIGSILNRLLGRYEYSEYNINILRTECGVALLGNENKDSSCTKCDHKPLMICGDNTIAAYFEPGVVVLTDFTPIYNCCNEQTLIFLKNTANFFKGQNILAVWEGLSFGQRLPENTTIIDKLGLNIGSFRHTSKITSSVLQNYNQLWIFVPGFCSVFDEMGKTMECKDVVAWDADEAAAVKNFVDGGGKLLLVTDYTPFTTQSLINNILSQLDYKSKINGECSCGCNLAEEKIGEIVDHPITQGISDWTVKAGAGLVC